jgi:hypothetical protein
MALTLFMGGQGVRTGQFECVAATNRTRRRTVASAEPAFLDPWAPAVIVAILLCVDARCVWFVTHERWLYSGEEVPFWSASRGLALAGHRRLAARTEGAARRGHARSFG